MSAQELGLVEGTPVGTSVIDAYAGGIGVMESFPQEFVRPQSTGQQRSTETCGSDNSCNWLSVCQVLAVKGLRVSTEISLFCGSEGADVAEGVEEVDELTTRMALVCGTSTCHMAVTKKKIFVPGVWGPFWSGT